MGILYFSKRGNGEPDKNTKKAQQGLFLLCLVFYISHLHMEVKPSGEHV